MIVRRGFVGLAVAVAMACANCNELGGTAFTLGCISLGSCHVKALQ